MKIGIFDSGIGGLTVLKELLAKYPNNQFYYLGDTAHVPYGSKSTEQIKSLAQKAVRHFIPLNIDILIVACNTVSALALEEVQSTLPNVPVIGVVQPGVQAVLSTLKHLQPDPDIRILILGTKATIQSGVYGVELRKHLTFSKITEQSCPLVVPFIEENQTQSPIFLDVLKDYVSPYIHDPTPGIALLACTHYPWAEAQFQKVLPQWTIINSAQAISESISTYLNHDKKGNSSSSSQVHFTWTDPQALSDFILNEFKNFSDR